MSSSLLSRFFQISGIFPTGFGCFLPANTTNKSCWVIKTLLHHFFAIFKVSRPAAFETETRPETFETEARKIGSRDSIIDDYLYMQFGFTAIIPCIQLHSDEIQEQISHLSS